MLVCPLYASLPTSMQSQAFDPAPPGTRKIILATNIAETSITLPGIRYVIDTGLVKVRGYQSRVGIETLNISPISQANANQRMGRAGREAPGHCFRLYTEKAFESLPQQQEPEIKRCNLSSVVLLLKASGVEDVLGFEYMDQPPRDASMSFFIF
jgi:ATP-dependent RNA helicase DHX8/PRP22